MKTFFHFLHILLVTRTFTCIKCVKSKGIYTRLGIPSHIKTVSEEIASPTEIQVFWMKDFAIA